MNSQQPEKNSYPSILLPELQHPLHFDSAAFSPHGCSTGIPSLKLMSHPVVPKGVSLAFREFQKHNRNVALAAVLPSGTIEAGEANTGHRSPQNKSNKTPNIPAHKLPEQLDFITLLTSLGLLTDFNT